MRKKTWDIWDNFQKFLKFPPHYPLVIANFKGNPQQLIYWFRQQQWENSGYQSQYRLFTCWKWYCILIISIYRRLFFCSYHYCYFYYYDTHFELFCIFNVIYLRTKKNYKNKFFFLIFCGNNIVYLIFKIYLTKTKKNLSSFWPCWRSIDGNVCCLKF